MHPELPEEHGLRDHRVSDSHFPHRLHQSPDEQLPGSRSRALSLREHQHHCSESGHREHQDQSGSAGDHGRCVFSAGGPQEDFRGHVTLSKVLL